MIETIDEIIKQLQTEDKRPKSREAALAITKLQEAQFWILKANEPN